MSPPPISSNHSGRPRSFLWLGWMAAIMGLLLGIYILTFAYWWLRSPSSVFLDDGKRVHLVAFKWSKAYIATEELWVPAFWFMKHVMGYQKMGSILMFENSITHYIKKEP